jgi:hypothetical protein
MRLLFGNWGRVECFERVVDVVSMRLASCRILQQSRVYYGKVEYNV